jgi:hypothetical protein
VNWFYARPHREQIALLVASSADGGGQQARFLIRWEQSS